MDVLPTNLLRILSVSILFSVVLMSLIQRLKVLSILKKKSHILLANFIFSFLLGIPFGVEFYQLSISEGIWVGVFSFIGASKIYENLKNYNPISLSNVSSNENMSLKNKGKSYNSQ